ncbi:MAG: site-specific integrase [Bacteroidales bacterium]|jgi:site-specific recombinase XerD
MKSTFRLLFFIKRNAIKQSGKAPIIARITLDGKIAQISTKLEIEPSLWNIKHGKASGKALEANAINNSIDSIRSTIFNHYQNFRERKANVTAEIIKNAFLGLSESNETVLKLFDKHNDNLAKMINLEIGEISYKRYLLGRKRLSDFIYYKYKVSDIAIKNITPTFIRDFEVYLRSDCKLTTNVAAKTLQYLKRIIVIAFNDGVINSNPFAYFKIKKERVERGYLDQSELDVIMQKYIPIKRVDNVRDIFVFCCYTGLSYIDVHALKSDNIRTAFDGNPWIMTKRHKTEVPVNVRLLDVPKKIIAKYSGQLLNGKLLPVSSNQKMNAYLKELADICGITKNITTHMARHTFATTITLSNGVPIETVSKMLGHTNIKTTQIYAKITDLKISSDMEKLAGKLNKQ